MTKVKLYALLTLLKAYRAALTFAGDSAWDHDSYHANADKVIRDVRFAIANGGFYRLPAKQIAA